MTSGPRLPRALFPLLAAVGLAACLKPSSDTGCDVDGCTFTREQWQRLTSLSGLGAPAVDASNRLVGDERAVQLGWRLYFDPDLSGDASGVDTLGRTTTSPRAAVGTRLKISCATCHNPAHGGGDTSSPAQVSVGAGWYDVNGQQSTNAAYQPLLYWNGRSDSLWGQAAAVLESGVSMNGSRLAIAWTVADKYRAAHDELFPDDPLPLPGKSADVVALFPDPTKPSGACAGGAAPDCAAGCRVATNAETAASVCVPRFPLRGKRGRKPGCQVGDVAEPFGDAYDCMADEDRAAVDRVLVHVAKVIGAYEFELRSRNAPFDQFVAEGPASAAISEPAKLGARLFVGRASCIDCHATPLLSDGGFHDVGVAQTGTAVPTVADCYAGNAACDCTAGTSCLPWGFYDGLGKLKSSPFLRSGAFSDDPQRGASHAGYYAATASDDLKGRWRTPSLRDVALTAPYMHTGALRTLEDVVWHYDQGGGATDGHHKALELRPLFLAPAEREALVEFLKTLTGKPDRPELHAPPPGARL